MRPAHRKALNRGHAEARTLVEWLCVDQKILLRNVLKDLGLGGEQKFFAVRLRDFDELGVMGKVQRIGKCFYELGCVNRENNDIWKKLARHPSDTARQWGAFALVADETMTLEKVLRRIKVFAADDNMGVRECAWISVRPRLAQELRKGLKLLLPWVVDENANYRRFASELTRPCGVWCAHILELKAKPELGLRLLERLRSDPSRYVQNSVGNWLNDASKSQPSWVKAVCARWRKESKTKETEYIVRRALRTLRKSGAKKITRKD